MSELFTSDELVPPSAADATAPPLGRIHARRLRDIYRSAGWPCQDGVEVELLAAGLVAQVHDPQGRASLRVTDSGIALLAGTLVKNRAALSAHQALEERIAREMQRAGRIVWRGLSLRAQVPGEAADGPPRWCIARPDVFSIRNTSVEAYVQPVVHEIKVRRADLLGDLRKPAKRAAYLDMAAECWYVLGSDARGRCIAAPEEIPPECGVLVAEGPADAPRLSVARPAPRRPMALPFGIWLALAKATPLPVLGDDDQALLGPCAHG
ncbi:MAG: hypothetical protein V4505_04380 [Pseudomonadota bacterium]